MTDTLSPTEAAAARKYAADYARTETRSASAERVTTAAQELAAARKVLPPPWVVVMDRIAGRGNTIADVARLGGITAEAVEQAFLRSCRRLAEHYEAAAS